MAKKNKKSKKNKKIEITIDNDDMFMILAESEYQLMMMHAKLMIIEEHLGYDSEFIGEIAENKFIESVMGDDE